MDRDDIYESKESAVKADMFIDKLKEENRVLREENAKLEENLRVLKDFIRDLRETMEGMC